MSKTKNQSLCLFHNSFWTDQNGNHPQPFTTITIEDVENGIYIPKENKEFILDYLKNIKSENPTHNFSVYEG
jgi:hypothetical protein